LWPSSTRATESATWWPDGSIDTVEVTDGSATLENRTYSNTAAEADRPLLQTPTDGASGVTTYGYTSRDYLASSRNPPNPPDSRVTSLRIGDGDRERANITEFLPDTGSARSRSCCRLGTRIPYRVGTRCVGLALAPEYG
jgi:hypothetical protein